VSTLLLCQRCGDEFAPASTLGPPAKWCSRTCRENAYRERKQGIVHRERWPYEARPWIAQAECVNWLGIVDWFDPDDYDTAKDICGTCDVTAECLDYALRSRQDLGVWGGLSPKQRDKVGRRK